MSADTLFGMANNVALAGWIALVFFGRRKWAAPLLCGFIIPALLGGLYLFLIATHIGESQGSFSTLGGVAALFANRYLLLAGWVHYLAFDLFIGSWEVRDAATRAIPHWLTVPCLAVTFLLGPIGLLLYLGLRLCYRDRH